MQSFSSSRAELSIENVETKKFVFEAINNSIIVGLWLWSKGANFTF